VREDQEADRMSPTDKPPVEPPTEELRLTDEPPTTPLGLPAPDGTAAAGRPRRARAPLTAFAGVLTVVLVVLALGVVGAQVFSIAYGEPGPGAAEVTVHLAVAVGSVALYRLVSTRRGLTRLFAALLLLVAAAAVFWFFWWA
jgi:hypothetical protein